VRELDDKIIGFLLDGSGFCADVGELLFAEISLHV
jgi:hypothetical protein